jgi:pimeloyl-ACP methyl ester carboxylesterase
MALPAETRHATADDGCPLAYQVIGDGPSDLVWSFSFLSDVETIWGYPAIADFLSRLASFTRLIIHDRRGMGRSGRGTGPVDPVTASSDLMSVLDAAGIDRAFFGGPEIGGALSAVFAATHPERVRGVIWYGAFASSKLTPDYPWGDTEDEQEEDRRRVEEHWGTRGFAENFVRNNAPSRDGDQATITFFTTWMRRSMTPVEASAMSQRWFDIDLRATLPTITRPVLIISRASKDIEEDRYAASLIPTARIIELPGDDFMPFFDEQPIIDATQRFIRDRGP